MSDIKPLSLVYVPVDVNVELPATTNDVSKTHITLPSGSKGYRSQLPENRDMWVRYNGSTGNFDKINIVTHWLKPTDNVYVLTKEELVKLLEDCYSEAAWQEQDGYHARNTEKAMKEQYINSLLK